MSKQDIYYDEEFKRTLVDLYHNGKTQAALVREYSMSQTTLTSWIKQYSTIKTEDGDILTAKKLQKQNTQL